uniref:Peroxisomal targeting signal 1 receptor n=1 Tax=Plectus sambesii TaxID=2011161 RepID=A0A914XHP5_9BILA
DYSLQEANPYLNVDNPLEEGKRLWSLGELANAILHFEAAVQRDPQSSEAWRYLGSAQAENEQEPSAIAALRKSLDLNPSNMDALFSLAVAYTNESMDNSALSTLERWLAANSAYQGLVEGADINFRRPMTSSFLDRQYFGELERKFLEAAQRQPAGVDATLQNALAVLYNLSGNFDRAIDSLQAALTVKPEDPRVWNRLGATLANSDRPAEAVAAYSRALDLYPGYVRARYNLGISCMNLKSNREAVEHFLSALQLQQRGIGPDSRQQISDGIWQTLRSAVMRMERSDELLRAAEGKNVAEFARTFHQIAPSNMSSMAQHDQTN